jgi:pyruvate-ferredoxin/flavodoxin oxidoreductase
VEEFLSQQTRFKMLTRSNPEDARRLWKQAQQDVTDRYRLFESLAHQGTLEASKQPAKA